MNPSLTYTDLTSTGTISSGIIFSLLSSFITEVKYIVMREEWGNNERKNFNKVSQCGASLRL